MNDLSKHLTNAASHASLTREEKSTMRAALLHTIHSKRILSPYWNPLFARMSAALMIVLVLGAGTAFASENSVPGDLLYPLKTNVVEPVQGVAAVTPTAQIKWNAELATRRAEEAETLAAKGLLSTTTAADIEARIAKNTDAIEKARTRLALADEKSAARFRNELDSSLSAHSDILSELGSTTDNGVTKLAAANLSKYLRRIRALDTAIAVATTEGASSEAPAPALMSTSLATSAPEQALRPLAKEVIKKTEEGDDEDLSRLKDSGRELLEHIHSAFDVLHNSLATSTRDRFEKRFSEIESELDDATDTESVGGALHNATRLRTILEASGRLKRNDLLDSSLNGVLPATREPEDLLEEDD